MGKHAWNQPRPQAMRPAVTTQTPQVKTAMPEIKIQEATTMAQEPAIEDRRFWAAGKPMPEAYQKRQVLPCPACRRVLCDDAGRAVKCNSSGSEVAYFECKVCGHRWALPVKE